MMAWSLSAEACSLLKLHYSYRSATNEPLLTKHVEVTGDFQDRAQLRNEFLQFDTDNKGTITHLQVSQLFVKEVNLCGILLKF